MASSAGIVAGAAGGIALGALAGGIYASMLPLDGTDHVRRSRYSSISGYTLYPQSQDAARSTLRWNQAAAIGAVGAGVAALAAAVTWRGRGAISTATDALVTSGIGAAFITGGVVSAIRIGNVEDRIDKRLPKHTPNGSPDMSRKPRVQSKLMPSLPVAFPSSYAAAARTR